MESPTFEAPPVGKLGTFYKVLLALTTLPFPLPFTATIVPVEGGFWSEAISPSAAASDLIPIFQPLCKNLVIANLFIIGRICK